MAPPVALTVNPLSSLLALSEEDKASRGVLHTPREIAQQPALWRTTLDCLRGRHAEIRAFLKAAGLDSAQKPTVLLAGAGSSDYIGRSLAPLLRRLWQCEVAAVPSTDLLTHPENFIAPGRRHLWISFSRSGESPEGVAVLLQALARHPGIHHLIVSCNAQGRMLRETAACKQVLGVALPDAANDRGLAMTSSFSNMVVFGQALANIDNLDGYAATVDSLARAGEHFLHAAAESAAHLAGQSLAKACFVGSGPLKAVAKESALKLLELTAGKILTASESALGLRHGPMAALDHDTLLVAFLSGDANVRRYETDLLEEIGRKRLVTTRVAVCQSSGPEIRACAEHVLESAASPPLADDYRPPLDVIFGQLLGLFFSLRANLKPDCPSPNGAISRVVQNFVIHS